MDLAEEFYLQTRPSLHRIMFTDKVWMYEEIMMNDDNLESNLLTSILLKIRSLYKFCYMLGQTSVKK